MVKASFQHKLTASSSISLLDTDHPMILAAVIITPARTLEFILQLEMDSGLPFSSRLST